MEPVDQTEIGHGVGNCTEACVASILEIPLSKVPDIQLLAEERDVWWGQALIDLFRDRGWGLVLCNVHGWPRQERARLAPQGHVIAGGPSPRARPDEEDHPGHSVVYKDGELAHDPHPSREGLAGPPTEFWIPVPPQGAL